MLSVWNAVSNPAPVLQEPRGIGVIDTAGNVVVPFGTYSWIGPFSDGVATVRSGLVPGHGVIDTAGNLIVPITDRYNEIWSFSGGFAVVQVGSGSERKLGVIDKTGAEVIPPIYDAIHPISNGVAVVNEGGQWGVIALPQAPIETASGWAREGITNAIAAGLVPQSLQSNYTQATTRAEFCALAVMLYESIMGEITGRVTFTDTDDVNVQKMAYIGVVGGVGNNRFDPNGTLTREQAAVMLYRLSDAIGQPFPAQAPTFADNNIASSWALEGIGRVQASGLMGGTGNNNFSPQQQFTREQSIITFLRFFETIE
jgi:hypothetical protein